MVLDASIRSWHAGVDLRQVLIEKVSLVSQSPLKDRRLQAGLQKLFHSLQLKSTFEQKIIRSFANISCDLLFWLYFKSILVNKRTRVR